MLEAIKGLKTVQQIAADNHLHPFQVTQWKKAMLAFHLTDAQKSRAGARERGYFAGAPAGAGAGTKSGSAFNAELYTPHESGSVIQSQAKRS